MSQSILKMPSLPLRYVNIVREPIFKRGLEEWFRSTPSIQKADVCHAYQILKAHGIPDERIVVMMYDDIANNLSNPDPGKIINKPGGPNVYPGVHKDYVKDDVTPEIFLKVLQGEKMGTGSRKTIKSGPNDNICVNLVDRGAPGIFAFPNEVLHVKDLNDALKSMHKKRKFNQEDLSVETLLKQYKVAKEETDTSHVQRYGDMKMGSDVLDDFQGTINATGRVFDPTPVRI